MLSYSFSFCILLLSFAVMQSDFWSPRLTPLHHFRIMYQLHVVCAVSTYSNESHGRCRAATVTSPLPLSFCLSQQFKCLLMFCQFSSGWILVLYARYSLAFHAFGCLCGFHSKACFVMFVFYSKCILTWLTWLFCWTHLLSFFFF